MSNAMNNLTNKTGNDARNQGKHVHVIGIAGSAMSPLAGMLREKGFRVTGSDAGIYPPMSTFLEGKGIKLSEGYKPGNIPANTISG